MTKQRLGRNPFQKGKTATPSAGASKKKKSAPSRRAKAGPSSSSVLDALIAAVRNMVDRISREIVAAMTAAMRRFANA